MSILRPNRRKDRNKDPEARAFMAWVKCLPCCVCYLELYADRALLAAVIELAAFTGNPLSEFAHIGGNAAAKASNWHGIPLCTEHHRTGPNCQERLKAGFGEFWGIDVQQTIAALREEYSHTLDS